MIKNKINSVSHEVFKKEALHKPKVKLAYDALEEEYAQLDEMLKTRKKLHKTQVDVAIEMNTSQAAVARIEKGMTSQGACSPTLKTLRKYAHALGCRLIIKLVPIRN